MSRNAVYDVVIAGAGPVGLFLASELALRRCSVLILEKSDASDNPLKRVPFGIRGLSSLSVEHLDRRGLLDKLQLHKKLKNPHRNTGTGENRQAGHFAGIPFYDGNIDDSQWKYRLSSSTPSHLISEMAELETILTQQALSLGVEIQRGLAVTDFVQAQDEVAIKSDERIFKAQWLVGCDGGRSAVRKLGGFEFSGTEPLFTGYSIKLEMVDPEKLKMGRVVTPQGMYILSQVDYLIMQDFDGGKFHDSKQEAGLDHIQALIRKISGTDVTIKALHTVTTWTDRARQATKYRKGRVLLAGDAAHIHAPLGGQGLNLGLGDAMNLGWKLASTIHGTAPEGLLDSYERERQPVGIDVLEWSRAQVAIMKKDPEAQALYSILRDLMNTRDGATYFAGRIWGISTHYDLGGEYPLAGYSAPNFKFEDGKTVGELMREGQGLLVEFHASGSLRDLAKEYKGQVHYVSGLAKESLGLSCVLIRPDGIVAWATENQPDEVSVRRQLSFLLSV